MAMLQRHPYTERTVDGFTATNCGTLTVAQPSTGFHCTLSWGANENHHTAVLVQPVHKQDFKQGLKV